jgi:ribosomal protein S6--L-glutamate ligase
VSVKIGFLARRVAEVMHADKHRRLAEEVLRAGHEVVTAELDDLIVEAETGRTKVRMRGGDFPWCDTFYWTFAHADTEAWVLTRAVEEAGQRFFMSTRLPITDKVTQAFLLSGCGVPIPFTRVVCLRRFAAVAGALPFPLVMKGRFGAKGNQVRWVEDKMDVWKVGGELGLADDEPFVLQGPVYPLGRDIRAFVVGGRVVACMERRAPEGDFRTNYTLYHDAVPAVLTQAEEEMALVAHRAFGGPVAGVDIMRGKDGPVVLEVNLWPGLAGIEAVTGVNVAAEMVREMVARV